jgi:hypothetical protein
LFLRFFVSSLFFAAASHFANCDFIQRLDRFPLRLLPDVAAVFQHFLGDVPGDGLIVCSLASGDSASFVIAWCRRSCGLNPPRPASSVSFRHAVLQPQRLGGFAGS